jgi:hypothetical protein
VGLGGMGLFVLLLMQCKARGAMCNQMQEIVTVER